MSGTILDTIVARKREEIAEHRRRTPPAELASRTRQAAPVRGFTDAMCRAAVPGSSGVIAEIKKASPSRGVIRADFDPAAIAAAYQAAGATCLSVLTDRDFFAGDDEHLAAARRAAELPILRKDFIIDSYQVTQTRAIGADCLLLIVAALDDGQLRALYDQALEEGLDVLVEVHDAAELERALTLSPRIVGINNRDLRTFETRLETTFELCRELPDGVLPVTESGIHTTADVAAMHGAGVHGFLVGEAFMRAEDPGAALQALFGPGRGRL